MRCQIQLGMAHGGSKRGREALELADYKIRIPMIGMIHSLNLSVSVGIILYEAFKQRKAKGFYEKRRLSPEEFDIFLKEWLNKHSEM